MNNNFLLQNFIQNGSNVNLSEPQRPKKSTRIGSQQLQLQVGTIFNEVCQLLQDNNINVTIPEEVPKTTEKISLFKNIIEQLIMQNGPSENIANNESNIISCPDCQNYEANLQKLENQVRQHIRLEQQLKVFQDTQEDKLDQFKKEKKDYQKKIDNLKKQLQDSKSLSATINQKVKKLESDNDHYKKQIRELKRSVSTMQEPLNTKRDSHKGSAYAYESKENRIDWVHRNVSIKKDDKHDKHERKSIEKRNQSAQKNWRMSSNAKSNKMISVMNDKLVHEKTKEERRKVIQSKFDYRR